MTPVNQDPVVFAWIDNEQCANGALYADGTLRISIPDPSGQRVVRIQADRLLELVRRPSWLRPPVTTVHLSGGRWVDIPMAVDEVVRVLADPGDGRFVAVTDISGETVRVNRDHVALIVERGAA